MNETWTTIVGTAVTDAKVLAMPDGTFLAKFRLVSSTRRLDRKRGEWRDCDTMFLTVTAWRRLGQNAARTVVKGTPVIVHGRLLVREYESRTGDKRRDIELEAVSIGVDLARALVAPVRPEPVPQPVGGAPVAPDPCGEPAPDLAARTSACVPDDDVAEVA